MKKIFLIALSSIICIQSNQAQEIKREVFDSDLGSPKIIVFDDNSSLTVDDVVPFLRNHLKLTPNVSFVQDKNQVIDENRSVIRLKQTVQGNKIFDSYYNVHTEEGLVKKINGKFIPNVGVVSPAISKKSAIDFALNYFDAQEYYWQNDFEESLIKRIENDPAATNYPHPELTYTQNENGEWILTFEMDIFSTQPKRGEKVFVNAISGKIERVLPLFHDVEQHAVGISKFSDTVPIVTTMDSVGVYSLKDPTRGGGVETYDLNEGTDDQFAVDFIHDDTIWDITNAQKDEVAIDAHWGAETTYDYYIEKHNRDSYDDNGTVLLSYVHYSTNYSNAQWSWNRMEYGDGSANGNPYISIDIVGHEITHGVTQRSANLTYSGESGALNESFSDIFGNAIEYYADSNRAEWLMGEQCFNSLRNMADPNDYSDPDTYGGNSWANTAPTAFDNGGVHINSGVQNFWFYLLVEGGSGVNDNGDSYNVQPMGWEVASEIAYRNLNEYLGPSSNYMDARDFSYEVAADMFGDCSPEALNVIEAWHAVGVGFRFDADVEPNFSMNYDYACSLPFSAQLNNLTNQNATYNWDFGNGNTSSMESPTAIFNQEGTYTITLEATVSNQCFTKDSTITREINVINLGTTREANCIPTSTTPSNAIGINSVGINNLFYESGLEDGNYNDYTCETNTALHVDSTYQLNVMASASTSQNTYVWIDFNNDGDFADSENVLTSSSITGLHTGEVDFSAYSGIVQGKAIRMRVMSDISFNNDVNPCSELRFGQTEDYSVVFVEGDGKIVINGLEDNLKSDFEIYPNPANEVITINGNSIYQISDLRGRAVLENINSGKVNIENLEQGIYFISDINNSANTKKFIKK